MTCHHCDQPLTTAVRWPLSGLPTPDAPDETPSCENTACHATAPCDECDDTRKCRACRGTGCLHVGECIVDDICPECGGSGKCPECCED